MGCINVYLRTIDNDCIPNVTFHGPADEGSRRNFRPAEHLVYESVIFINAT